MADHSFDEGKTSDSEEQEDWEAIHSSVELDVFCISANDYLKIKGIKPDRDGPDPTPTTRPDPDGMIYFIWKGFSDNITRSLQTY